jgi:hypothetical protein
MLRTCSNVGFGEAAARHRDNRSMSGLGRPRDFAKVTICAKRTLLIVAHGVVKTWSKICRTYNSSEPYLGTRLL